MKAIPTLRGEDAERFIKNAEENERKAEELKTESNRETTRGVRLMSEKTIQIWDEVSLSKIAKVVDERITTMLTVKDHNTQNWVNGISKSIVTISDGVVRFEDARVIVTFAMSLRGVER
jgi:hypothetical protein